jgi:outer membrane protein TolC
MQSRTANIEQPTSHPASSRGAGYWLLLPLVFLLSGCAHFTSQPLAPEKSAAQLDARRLDDTGLKHFVASNSVGQFKNWPPAKWDFSALTLAAFYFHPDLALARAQWQLTEAGEKTAGGRPNPTLTVTPEYNSSTLVPTPWAPAMNFDLPLETMGKRGKRMAEAQNNSEAARFNFISSAWHIRNGVRGALSEFSTAQKRSELLKKQFATQNEISRRLWQRFNAGALARSELVPAQMALNRTQLELASAQAKLGETRSRLAEAVGLPLAALDGIQFETEFQQPDLAALNSINARRAALLGRSDIRAALAEYAAAEANLRLEIAKQFPDVHLNPGYLYDQGDNKWSLGLTFELPLLNQNQGPIAESRARREVAAAKFLQLQAQVIGVTDRAVAGLAAAQAQLKTGDALLDMAQRQQKSVAAQVKAGSADPLDALNAEMELNTIRLGQLDGAAQFQAAVGALEDALQRPADEFDVLKFLPTKSQP